MSASTPLSYLPSMCSVSTLSGRRIAHTARCFVRFILRRMPQSWHKHLAQPGHACMLKDKLFLQSMPHHTNVCGICDCHSLCACPAIPVQIHRRHAQQPVPELNCNTLGCVQDLVSVRVTITLLYPTLSYFRTAPVESVNFDALHFIILLLLLVLSAAAQARGTQQ